jgi:hypothetical protein
MMNEIVIPEYLSKFVRVKMEVGTENTDQVVA